MVVCFLLCGIGIVGSCSSKKEAALIAEVEIAHQSVYVWNRGEQPWTGGMVFLNERSLKIQKAFGRINPGGFAQLPLREFKQGSSPVLEDTLKLRFVWAEIEGYAPKKFSIK
jgi:hypothetical protein